MLLSYAFSNFQSFAEQAEISFVLTQRDVTEGWVRTSRSGRRVATAMAVMGANGAGKSGVIRVGGLLAWFMSDSFSLPPENALPFRPHMARLDSPSEFSVVYEDDDGAEWTYELRIRANRVEFETLSRKGSELGSRPSRIFTREARGDGYAVSQNLGMADSEAMKVRPNVSMISWARQYGSDMALRIAKISLATNVDRWGREQPTASAQLAAAAYFEKHSAHCESMRSLMKQWDFGLSDVRLQSLPARPTAGGDLGDSEWIPVGIHLADDQTFELPFWHESSGTQRAFVLLWKLLPVLEQGGLALIDELEADLHPHMIEPLLRLFHSEETNPHGAQLVFTCHSPEVLRSFHRAQVTFVEKVECKSEVYRGDAIEGLTNQHNLYNKYLSGALGACAAGLTRMSIRKVKWTVLAVGEGDAEVAWLQHLKEAYFSRACGSTIKIQQAYGKGAANVVKQAITYAADRGYSRCMAVFDTDKDYNEAVIALARTHRLVMIPSEPCLEGLLLRLHDDAKTRTSEQHKRQFAQRFGARVQDEDVLRHHFGIAFIERIRDKEPLIHLLINTFGIPRRLARVSSV